MMLNNILINILKLINKKNDNKCKINILLNYNNNYRKISIN